MEMELFKKLNNVRIHKVLQKKAIESSNLNKQTNTINHQDWFNKSFSRFCKAFSLFFKHEYRFDSTKKANRKCKKNIVFFLNFLNVKKNLKM